MVVRLNRKRLNIAYPSTRRDKKKMVFVFNPKTHRINTIHFGQRGCRSNSSRKAWNQFMQRSAGITDGRGRHTKNNKLSANYWARKVLWNGGKWRK